MNKLSKWKKLEYAAIGFLLLCLVFLSFCFYKPEPAVVAERQSSYLRLTSSDYGTARKILGGMP